MAWCGPDVAKMARSGNLGQIDDSLISVNSGVSGITPLRSDAHGTRYPTPCRTEAISTALTEGYLTYIVATIMIMLEHGNMNIGLGGTS